MSSSIAVLDDRAAERDSLVKLIDVLLPEGWDCVEAPLFQDKARYPEWLVGNEIQVLMVDQVLGDQAPPNEPALSYKGHGVVESIRKKLPNFPAYIFTSQRDEDLPNHEGEAEDVIERGEFNKNPEKFVARMVRAGQRFHEEHERQLREMTRLAIRVANGTASREEKKQLNNLQISLGTPSGAAINVKREEALAGAEEKVTELEQLVREIENQIREAK